MSIRSLSFFPAALLLMLCTVFLMVRTAEAHVTGLSWIATTSPYVIDIGYDPNEFQARLSARFDFLLQKDTNNDPAAYDHVWVRLLHEQNTLLATGIRRQEIGPTTLLYSFPEAGNYELEASFRDQDGNEIVASSFPIVIRPDANAHTAYPLYALIFVLGAALGAIVLYLVVRKRSS